MVAGNQSVSQVGLQHTPPLVVGPDSHLHVLEGMRNWDGKLGRVYDCRLTTADPQFTRTPAGSTLIRAIAGEVRVSDRYDNSNAMAPAWSHILRSGEWFYLPPRGRFELMKLSYEPVHCIVVTMPAPEVQLLGERRLRGVIPWATPCRAAAGRFTYQVGPAIAGLTYTTEYDKVSHELCDSINLVAGGYSDTVQIVVSGFMPEEARILN